jgi:hypothetical protein
MTMASDGSGNLSDLGKEGQRALKALDRLLKEHAYHLEQAAERVPQIHEQILAYGRVLIGGKQLTVNNADFKAWCERWGFTKEKHKFGHPTERSNAMLIAHLTDEGVNPGGLDQDFDESDKLKLTLAGCNQTVPSNILQWARRSQPELFPGLSEKQACARERQKMRKRDTGERETITDDDVLIGSE